jgi:hypothetical protein
MASPYKPMKLGDVLAQVETEEQARTLFWRSKCGGKDFECPRCTHEGYYQYRTRPEIRECKLCNLVVRLRPGTMLEFSKVSLLAWARAVWLVAQDKRGISAVHLKRLLGESRYETAWRLLHKIREALRQRADRYKLTGVVELDGAKLDHIVSKGETRILVAVESKSFVDRKGRSRECAGFAKVEIAGESSIPVQRFCDRAIEPGSFVNTDGDPAYVKLQRVEVDSRVMNGVKAELDSWLPWVHRLISNAKTWLRGTYHSIRAKYLSLYLAEHFYRYNRRHDLDGMFQRVLRACVVASPVRVRTLFTRPVRTPGPTGSPAISCS